MFANLQDSYPILVKFLLSLINGKSHLNSIEAKFGRYALDLCTFLTVSLPVFYQLKDRYDWHLLETELEIFKDFC